MQAGLRAGDARVWHPWLRINRVLRAMVHERWSAEAWPQVKAEFRKALALRSQIRRAGWFIHENAPRVKAVLSDSPRSRVHQSSIRALSRMTSYAIVGDTRSPKVGVPIN